MRLLDEAIRNENDRRHGGSVGGGSNQANCFAMVGCAAQALPTASGSYRWIAMAVRLMAEL